MGQTAYELVSRAALKLLKAGTDTPRLDAELLMCHLMGWDSRTKIYTDERLLSDRQIELYEHLLSRRQKGEPIAYITGFKEFYGMKLKVRKGVFIPRPETEILVEKTLEEIDKRFKKSVRILDIGTGSGCIAISLCRFSPVEKTHIVAVDILKTAIQTASENAALSGCGKKINFILANFPGGIKGKFDIIISNPPYVSYGDKRIHHSVVNHEPGCAVFSGSTGLEFIQKISSASSKLLNKNGFVSIEVGAGQVTHAVDILKKDGFKSFKTFKDHAGITRVVIAFKN